MPLKENKQGTLPFIVKKPKDYLQIKIDNDPEIKKIVDSWDCKSEEDKDGCTKKKNVNK